MLDERMMRYVKLSKRHNPIYPCPLYNTQEDLTILSHSTTIFQKFETAFKSFFYDNSPPPPSSSSSSNLPLINFSELQEIFNNLSIIQRAEIHTILKNTFDQVVFGMKSNLSNISDILDESFLTYVVTQWMKLCEQINKVQKKFSVMESSFLAMGKASIWDIGTFSFRKQITSNMEFNKRLLGGFIMNVKKMREGNQINETSFKNSIQMFKVLKLYSILEKVILYESAKFYEQQSKILFLNGNVHEYLYYVKQRMKFEGEKMAPYFQIKTKDSLLKLVKSELIDKNADLIWKMFEQSFVTENVMLTDNKFRAQSLKSLYYFLVNMDSIELLQILIGSYYEQKGNLAFIKNSHDWYGLVNSLVQLKGEINTIVEGDYEDENSILKIKETWHRRIGKFVSENVTIIEFIANVINEFMRSPENSPEVWQKFEQNLTNFLSCMEDKTIFRVLYTSDLVKRLLFNETSGLEYEKYLGNIISTWMEEGFLKKLDVMLEDIATSKKINNSFRNSHCELDIYVNILTLNNWPNYLTNFVSSVNLSPTMLSIKNAFNNIIAKENNNKLKILKWHHGLDRCIVEATYPKGTIQVDLSLHSTLILLLFNDLKTVSKLSYKEIKNSINLDSVDLDSCLLSLVFGTVCFLKKEPSFHIITNTDKFYINERLLLNDLKSNGTPITIHDLEVNKKFKEVQGVRITRQIAEYRAIQLESLIMKIIKPEKKIHINELIDRILSHPRFDWATTKDILNQINKLKVNMYLKIDEKYLIYLP
ncbi:hypothetical protein Glove_192g8 [Diversispora epigaea]|uniref:Cullin family profile domain-containing protein n=1 Tax=Diversispora epigaea TaxID=1348612 RepID=A0A397ILK1_9GLOM|nr:hypothetical protein Glove_192g8 [Diversispora epigaea]